MRNVKMPRTRAERKRCPFTPPYHDDPREQRKKGECAVCGRPVPAPVPPRKDPNTPRFCENHDSDDLREIDGEWRAHEGPQGPRVDRHEP